MRAFTRSTEVEIVLVGAQGSRRIQGASLHLVTDDDVARFQACRPEDGSEFLWGRTRVALSDARGRVEIESVDAGVWLLVTAPGMEFAPRLVRPPKVALSVLEMSRASEVFLAYHGNSHDPQVCWRYSIEYVVPGKRLRVSDLLGGGFEFEEL